MVDKENILNTFSSDSDDTGAVQAKYEVGVKCITDSACNMHAI